MSAAADADDAAATEAAALRLLAGREHSRHELTRKLRQRGHADAVIGGVLDDLQRCQLLSDERFCEAYVRQRVARGYGPLRLRAELTERGVADGLFERVLAEAGIDWQQRLEALAVRKFGSAAPADRRARDRRGRYLQQRGFPLAMVRRYLLGLAVGDSAGEPFD
ncbi:MAG: regulatory protein RecX [Gammaproteobacteria bacterium]|nr:regulatory protein RecX [Gammaproteobacteria bacterium]